MSIIPQNLVHLYKEISTSKITKHSNNKIRKKVASSYKESDNRVT